MSQLGLILQESLPTQRESTTTILGLLTEQMEIDGVDRASRRRRSFKERFGFIGMGCCGATWGFGSSTLTPGHSGEEEEQQRHRHQHQIAGQDPNSSRPECVRPIPTGSGMNLAAALAAERQLRGPQEPDRGSVPGTPWRVSLMRLLEETEEVEEDKEKGVGLGAVGNDSMCCVCMGRKKGAAFIPCGHTFCRVCSRELWLNRGSCPLCNRSILEILDIF